MASPADASVAARLLSEGSTRPPAPQPSPTRPPREATAPGPAAARPAGDPAAVRPAGGERSAGRHAEALVERLGDGPRAGRQRGSDVPALLRDGGQRGSDVPARHRDGEPESGRQRGESNAAHQGDVPGGARQRGEAGARARGGAAPPVHRGDVSSADHGRGEIGAARRRGRDAADHHGAGRHAEAPGATKAAVAVPRPSTQEATASGPSGREAAAPRTGGREGVARRADRVETAGRPDIGIILPDQLLTREIKTPPAVPVTRGVAPCARAVATVGAPARLPVVPSKRPVPRRPAPAHRRPRRRWEVRYLARTVALDLVAGVIAAILAFEVRFGEPITPYNLTYLVLSALLPIGLFGALAVNRAYERRLLFVGTEEYQRVLSAGLALTATVAIGSYALDVHLARGYVLVALPLGTAACLLMRFGSRKALHRARRRGECLRRVIVVGHELAVVAITRQLRRERYHGLDVAGACLPPLRRGSIADIPVYGTFAEVPRAVRQAGADTVIVLSCPEFDGVRLRRLAWRLERDDVDLIVASSLMDVAGARTTIRPVDGLPMLHVEHPSLSGARRVVKDVFDRVGAAVLILLAAPILLGVALAVRLDSPGPILFRQVRVGRHGREFLIYKFRTMYTDAESRLAALRHLNEQDAVLFKMRDDPRITGAGKWLRRLSLDELPQLFNVLGGTMSLVGPRPPLPQEVAQYPADARRRLEVRPGMTGLWQVSGRSDLPWEEAVRLDLRYVENWSLTLDLIILLRTLTAVCRGAGAY
ncbi:sugar transferase [Virgisporangium aliadipatigenens]|uniref:sugar transferase n=1 Tax=Virgisporangium aliadipatigenens TaxID=741659 RepID=UPI0027E3EE41|nr:sugar transferase [Virgisporangium aliadipatigenens]